MGATQNRSVRVDKLSSSRTFRVRRAFAVEDASSTFASAVYLQAHRLIRKAGERASLAGIAWRKFPEGLALARAATFCQPTRSRSAAA